jgi:hypothetical protein
MHVIDGVDYLKWEAHARVLKFSPDQVRWVAKRNGIAVPLIGRRHLAGLQPEDGIAECHGNVLCTSGLNRITALIIGAGGQAMTNAQMMIGTGDTATTATAADTDMNAATGASHRYIQGSDASFPTQSNGLISGHATFASGNGNYTWNEWAWGIATGTLTAGTGSWASIAATSAVMVNHKAPASLGTKVSGAVWTLQTSVTLS